MENINYNIPKEKFRFADPSRRTGDKKFDTKPMSYAKDVFKRFCKNKSSVVAGIIILVLVAFAIFVPMFCETEYTLALTDTDRMKFVKLLPKCELFEGTGFWDGTKKESANANKLNVYKALEKETGRTVITKVIDESVKTSVAGDTTVYEVKIDSYVANGMTFIEFTEAEWKDVQRWQNENNIQIVYPAVDIMLKDSDNKELISKDKQKDANVWYATDSRGNPRLDANGNFVEAYARSTSDRFKGAAYTDFYSYDSLRVEGDDGTYLYALVSPLKIGEGQYAVTYKARVYLEGYFEYKYGLEPSFLFGTNEKGQDILTRLAAGARFSLILAICVSAVNLFIGAMYGAVEGFYGGVVDLAMERISDVLGGMPSMVVMSLFQLHLAAKVGPVWSMVFAFVLTGWLGMAGRTRMQFYRFKRQEYVLSARTLGASDGRLMFKHIFPNAMGTLITGSILMIPGVIFSESSLTYLGIVNLESSTQTSVGTLLANGNGMLAKFPHVIFWPALFISLLEISFNLFGNGLRDAFNPSLKGMED